MVIHGAYNCPLFVSTASASFLKINWRLGVCPRALYSTVADMVLLDQVIFFCRLWFQIGVEFCLNAFDKLDCHLTSQSSLFVWWGFQRRFEVYLLRGPSLLVLERLGGYPSRSSEVSTKLIGPFVVSPVLYFLSLIAEPALRLMDDKIEAMKLVEGQIFFYSLSAAAIVLKNFYMWASYLSLMKSLCSRSNIIC